MANRIIGQAEYLTIFNSGSYHDGYVRGLGKTGRIPKDFMIVPRTDMCQVQGCAVPSIGFISTIDASPSEVVRSYGDSLPSLILDRIVTNEFGYTIVHMGNHNTLKFDSTMKVDVKCIVTNMYQKDADVRIHVIHKDGKSLNITETVSYPLDSIMNIFDDTTIYELFVPTPENERIKDDMIDILNSHQNVSEAFHPNGKITKNDEISYTGLALGSSSLGVSLLDYNLTNRFENFVEETVNKKRIEMYNKERAAIQNELVNKYKSEIKGYISSKNKFVPYRRNANGEVRFSTPCQKEHFLEDVYRAESRAISDSHRIAYEKTKVSRTALRSGTDPRTTKTVKINSRVHALNTGLTWAGVIYSGYNFVDYCCEYGTYQGEEVPIYKNPTSYRMVCDLGASLIAFVPVWGWMVSGIYFGVTTIYDLSTARPDGPINNPWEDEMINGLRQDNTRVDMTQRNIKRDLMLKEIEDRNTPMRIAGRDIGMSRYEFRQMQSKIGNRKSYIGPKR